MNWVIFLSILVGGLVWFIVGGLYLITQTLGGRSGSRVSWWESVLMAPIFLLAHVVKILIYLRICR